MRKFLAIMAVTGVMTFGVSNVVIAQEEEMEDGGDDEDSHNGDTQESARFAKEIKSQNAPSEPNLAPETAQTSKS